MAGIGPAPKDPGQRRNRSAPLRGEWVDLQPLAEPVLPALGDPHMWSERSRLKWEAWRADPVSALWTPADVSFARDTLWLYEMMKASTASEVRLREDALGLTPKGKRDLRWRAPGDPAAGQPTVPRKPAAGSSRRRSRLSVVE